MTNAPHVALKAKRAKRRKSTTIEDAGIRVRIFKRGAMYWLECHRFEVRASAKTTIESQARENAHALAREIARQQLLGVKRETLTVGQLFDAYHRHKGRTLEGNWKKAAEARTRQFRAVWGDSLPVVSISQSTVDTYAIARRNAYVERQRARHDAQHERAVAYAVKMWRPAPAHTPFTPAPLRDGALDSDFRWLSSVFNWATSHKLPDGSRLLTVNPLHDCDWPRERKENIRRPVASHDRYTATLAQADKIDATGAFRLMLTLARYTARRIDAILHLSTSDLLLTPDRIRDALAAQGHDEGVASRMPYGAIRWRAAHDKQGIDRITPIAGAVRAEIDLYLAANPRIGDAVLFSAIEDPRRSLPRSTATKWLRKAEQLAGVPKLRGGLWHAYRRLWATERKNLPDVDVAEAGGWTGTKAMKASYQHATTDGVLAAVLAS